MDAILALNSGTNELGELSRDTTTRVDAAMELAEAHPGAHVLMVGRGAEGMRDHALRAHPDGPYPAIEDESLDTIEGAHFAKLQHLGPNAWNSIAVVTSDYHVARTAWTFDRVLGISYMAAVYSVESDHTSARAAWVARRERLQLAVARLKLVGLGPEDDERRAQRLGYFRFREGDSAFSRMMIMADNLTQPKRD